MEENLDVYRRKLTTYSIEELTGICGSIDKEKHNGKYLAVLEELKTRRESGAVIPDGDSNPETRFQTVWRRIGAVVVDGLIFFVPFIVLFKPFQALESGKVDLLAWNLFGLVSVVYTILMHWNFGATLGKILLRVRVVDNNTQSKIGFRQAVIRNAVPLGVMLISTIESGIFKRESSILNSLSDNLYGLWGIAGVVSVLINNRRRAVHDLIAGTVCIRTEV